MNPLQACIYIYLYTILRILPIVQYLQNFSLEYLEKIDRKEGTTTIIVPITIIDRRTEDFENFRTFSRRLLFFERYR